MTLQLLVIGLISILGQVIMLRELSVAFYGVELIYLLGIGTWLIGTGVGAVVGRRRALPSKPALRLLFLLFALLLPLDVALVRGLRDILGGVAGAYLPFGWQMVGMAVALLPIGFCLGLMFQWAAKHYVTGRRSLAAAYAIESTGAVVGGLASTAFLAMGVQNFALALGCALAATVVPVLDASSRHTERRAVVRVSSFVVVVLLAAGLVYASTLDDAMTSWNHPQLVVSRDSPYGRVTVSALGGQLSVYENDALSFETEGTTAEELAHLAALQHPLPESVLVLGGGMDGTIREMLKHRPDRVDYVELNGALLSTVLPLMPDNVRSSLEDARTHVTRSDPRRALARLGQYDAILVGMPDPSSAQTNRFYSREFFALARAHLRPGGVLAFRLNSAENYWTSSLAMRNAAVVHALEAVFPSVIVLPGSVNIVLASDRPLTRDPAVLIERFESRQITARKVTPRYIEYLYTNDRFRDIAQAIAAVNVAVNSDERPICFLYATSVWLSKFFPRMLAQEFGPSGSTRLLLRAVAGAIGLSLVMLFVLARRRTVLKATLLAGVAGFCGMLFETLFIVQYQANRGVLYQDIGLLLTAFMIGLAAGAYAAHRVGERMVGSGRAFGVSLLVAFCAVGVAIVLLTYGGLGGGIMGIGALLAVSGFLVAALFGYASWTGRVEQRVLVSPLYAADLIGGAVASVLASLLWIPILGLGGTALIGVAVGILGLALV